MSKSHGLAKTTEHSTWCWMKSRCFNPNNQRYAQYGGRGITVCAGWRNTFPAFLQDMGKRPSPQHSIERRDNDGPYSCGHCDECKAKNWPGNCYWGTKLEQARNRSNNIYLSHNGERLLLSEWAKKLGIKRLTLSHRYHKGWPTSEILETPVGKCTRQLRPVQDIIIEALRTGPKMPREIERVTGLSYNSIRSVLASMNKSHRVRRVPAGWIPA